MRLSIKELLLALDFKTKKKKVKIDLSMTALVATSLVYFTNCEYAWPSNTRAFDPS